MFANWIIAAVISGGAAGWVYNKLLHRNGNPTDTRIAAGVVWFAGFVIIFLILRSFGD